MLRGPPHGSVQDACAVLVPAAPTHPCSSPPTSVRAPVSSSTPAPDTPVSASVPDRLSPSVPVSVPRSSRIICISRIHDHVYAVSTPVTAAVSTVCVCLLVPPAPPSSRLPPGECDFMGRDLSQRGKHVLRPVTSNCVHTLSPWPLPPAAELPPERPLWGQPGRRLSQLLWPR